MLDFVKHQLNADSRVRTHQHIYIYRHTHTTLILYLLIQCSGYNNYCKHNIILSFNVYVDISILQLNVVFECCTWATIYVQYVCMCLTRCHEFPFPATRGHLPRGATFAQNRRWPLVAGTTVYAKICPENLTNFLPSARNSTAIMASILMRIHVANPRPLDHFLCFIVLFFLRIVF